MAKVQLQGLNKVYENGFHAVHDFDMEIEDGEFVVLVGASGCGKSTTLRMIAGLEEISKGDMILDGKNVTNAAPKDRDIAMVFQNYALYPQMTVYQNMAFSLKMKKTDADVVHQKVLDAAYVLGLSTQLNKKPAQLSGGQRQRVAVGRALVREPKLFLFDEPLSNLDAKLRGEMRHEIKLLHQQLKSTMIYVTHDQIEALTLADRIVVMNNGYVQQIGTPLELYERPANLYVAGFIGLPPMNFIEATAEKGRLVTPLFDLKLPKAKEALVKEREGKSIVLGIRPEHIRADDGEIGFTVSLNENLGQSTLVHGYVGGKKLICKLGGWCEYKKDDKIKIGFDADNIHLFDKETERAIV